MTSSGTMVIAASSHNRILAATLDGGFLWELSTIPDSVQPLLRQPPWIRLIGKDRVVIRERRDLH